MQVGVKLLADNCDIAYPPVFQSGGHYDFRMAATSDDTPLHAGVIVCSLGARYSFYCANLSRTIFINPTKKQVRRGRSDGVPVGRHHLLVVFCVHAVRAGLFVSGGGGGGRAAVRSDRAGDEATGCWIGARGERAREQVRTVRPTGLGRERAWACACFLRFCVCKQEGEYAALLAAQDAVIGALKDGAPASAAADAALKVRPAVSGCGAASLLRDVPHSGRCVCEEGGARAWRLLLGPPQRLLGMSLAGTHAIARLPACPRHVPSSCALTMTRRRSRTRATPSWWST